MRKHMSLNELLQQLKTDPQSVEFQQVIDLINSLYDYTPTPFSNGLGEGTVANAAGTNEGSCRIFAFAKLNGLDQAQTLACFGRFYRVDVLQNPAGGDHANIRNFMRHGWEGIRFEGEALKLK